MSQAASQAYADGTQSITSGDAISGAGSKNSTWIMVAVFAAILALLWFQNRSKK